MITHLTYDQLIDYATGNRQDASNHIAGCAQCNAIVKRFRSIGELIRSDASVMPPVRTVARAQAIFAKSQRRPVAAPMNFSWSFAFVSAGLSLFFFVAGFMLAQNSMIGISIQPRNPAFNADAAKTPAPDRTAVIDIPRHTPIPERDSNTPPKVPKLLPDPNLEEPVLSNLNFDLQVWPAVSSDILTVVVPVDLPADEPAVTNAPAAPAASAPADQSPAAPAPAAPASQPANDGQPKNDPAPQTNNPPVSNPGTTNPPASNPPPAPPASNPPASNPPPAPPPNNPPPPVNNPPPPAPANPPAPPPANPPAPAPKATPPVSNPGHWTAGPVPGTKGGA